MIFSFCIENHAVRSAPFHMTEFIRMLKYGIEANRHEFLINYHLIPDASVINIVVENFDHLFLNKLQALTEQGGRFILIGTDYVGQGTFNDFLKEGELGPAASRVVRYNTFAGAAKHCLACWHTVPWQVPLHETAFGLKQVLPLVNGYHPGLDRVRHKPYKDIDVIFTGSSSPYRQTVLQALSAQGVTVYQEHVKTVDYMREELVGRSKMAVNIRQTPEFPYNSGGRLSYHVGNRSALLSETSTMACDMEPYVLHADAGAPFIEAVMTLLDSDLESVASEAHARFQQERPLQTVFEALLEETFSPAAAPTRTPMESLA